MLIFSASYEAFRPIPCAGFHPSRRAAQIFQFTREQIIEYTPNKPFDRSADGRPKVPDDLLKKLQDVSAEEVWTILILGRRAAFSPPNKSAIWPRNTACTTSVDHGFITIPDKPGLGTTWNDEAVKAHLAPGTPFFPPTEEWNNEGQHVKDRIWS